LEFVNRSAANAGSSFFQTAPASCFSANYAVTHIVDNVLKCGEGESVLAGQRRAASL